MLHVHDDEDDSSDGGRRGNNANKKCEHLFHFFFFKIFFLFFFSWQCFSFCELLTHKVTTALHPRASASPPPLSKSGAASSNEKARHALLHAVFKGVLLKAVGSGSGCTGSGSTRGFS